MSTSTPQVWFVQIAQHEEGPFSLAELKKDLRLTPDTLVWKEGFPQWIPIGKVPELKEVFADEPSPKKNAAEPQEDQEEEEEGDDDKKLPKKLKSALPSTDEIVLDLRREPPLFAFWILIFLLLLIYVLNRLR